MSHRVYQTNFCGFASFDFCFGGTLEECEIYIEKVKARSFCRPEFVIVPVEVQR